MSDLRTALNRMLWRRSGKGAWCVFCMADTGNDHEPDCPTIEVHAALAQSEGEEINRLAREKLHRSGKNLVPEDTPAPTVCPNPECKDGLLWQDDGGHGVRDKPCPDCGERRDTNSGPMWTHKGNGTHKRMVSPR